MKSNKCIRNLLKLINLLQNNSINNCSMNDGCTKPFLGPSINNICYNTRVITLYKKNGDIFSTTYNNNDVYVSSSFFRVNNLTDDCVTLLILEESEGNYYSTGQFITLNIGCICAIKCIDDVVVNNL